MEATLGQFKAILRTLDEEQQRDLLNFLRRNLAPKPDRATAASREVAALTAGATRVTYRTEFVKCKKPGCRCASTPGHGPYVYKYWRESGKLRKAYVGPQKRVRRAKASTRPGPA